MLLNVEIEQNLFASEPKYIYNQNLLVTLCDAHQHLYTLTNNPSALNTQLKWKHEYTSLRVSYLNVEIKILTYDKINPSQI